MHNVSPVLTLFAEGIYACPAVVHGVAAFQVFGNTPGFDRTDCTMLDGLVPYCLPERTIGAFQYE
jgi:hypothetical protein